MYRRVLVRTGRGYRRRNRPRASHSDRSLRSTRSRERQTQASPTRYLGKQDALSRAERSLRGARTEQRTAKAARDCENTLRIETGARTEPERNPNKERTPKRARDTERTFEVRIEVRSEQKSSKGPQDSEGTLGVKSRSRSEQRTPKGPRDFERALGVSKLDYHKTAESPVISGRIKAPQFRQTYMSLPICMRTGTVALCKTDSVSCAHTHMPLHPMETHFHTPNNRSSEA